MGTGRKFWVTIVYAYNDMALRRPLWQDIKEVYDQMNGPWAVLGDINCVLNMDERIGSPIALAKIKDFRKCVGECNLQDLKSSGTFYTWNNKQEGQYRVYNRIDRVIVSIEWMVALPDSQVHFMSEGLFDHYPALINCKDESRGSHEGIKSLEIQQDPRNEELLKKERLLSEDCYSWIEAMNQYLSQKCKLQWLAQGDQNTKMFHSMLKTGRNTSRIFSDLRHQQRGLQLRSLNSTKIYWELVQLMEVNTCLVREGNILKDDQRSMLEREFNSEEVKEALWGISGDKSPGLDGYGSQFFKDSWDIVKGDVIEAVM
ncbi:uncharacterized protein LOC142170629 [Nicotiana tabacum]|uniref:Uncharacterized protein LOC142170629 n=1 Tax=Nicotiana tabacum TaxID=4097 RepID=A0AC58SUI0_TOBAC